MDVLTEKQAQEQIERSLANIKGCCGVWLKEHIGTAGLLLELERRATRPEIIRGGLADKDAIVIKRSYMGEKRNADDAMVSFTTDQARLFLQVMEDIDRYHELKGQGLHAQAAGMLLGIGESFGKLDKLVNMLGRDIESLASIQGQRTRTARKTDSTQRDLHIIRKEARKAKPGTSKRALALRIRANWKELGLSKQFGERMITDHLSEHWK